MFDANASHIPCGQLFFAEVQALDSQLRQFGVNAGDLLLCEHVEKSGYRGRVNKQTKIYRSINLAPFVWMQNNGHCDFSWMVYSGRPDGSGFIDDKWESKAIEFLGGSWI